MTFSVVSPQPEVPTAAVVRSAPADSAHACTGFAQDGGGSEGPGPDLFSPNSIATSASSFVHHLNELVEETEPALADIPTFPHPRVENSPLGEGAALRPAEGHERGSSA